MVPCSVVALAGSGVFNPVMSSLVIGEGTDEHSALAAGVNDAFRQTGIALGIAALGTLIPSAGSSGAIDPEAFTTGLHHAFLVAAGIAFVGSIIGAVMIRTARTGPATPAGEPAIDDATASRRALVG